VEALLEEHASLLELDLSENQISDTGALRLLDFVSRAVTLQKLNLVGACIVVLCLVVLCVGTDGRALR
jgi:hypothetical protein